MKPLSEAVREFSALREDAGIRVIQITHLTMLVATLFHDLSERLNAHVEIDHDPLPSLGKIKNPKKGDA